MKTATEHSGAGWLPMLCAPEFVGRNRELAELTLALAGQPVVLIEGEAGIGKTRLVREYLASPAGRALRAVEACCPPFRQPQTLAPVADAVRQAAISLSGLCFTGLDGVLGRLFPEWSGELPPAPEPTGDATADRHRVFATLAGLLARLQVTALVVEDVHWADEVTLEFLLYLASRRPRQVSLVVTLRPEDVPEGSLLLRLSRLAAGTGGLLLTLRPLDTADTAGLVSSMLGGEHVSDQFAAFLHQHAEGVPLAVEELVRLLAARGDVFRRDGEWVRRHLGDIAVPPTIGYAVLERAGRLGPDAQAVLRAAAVLAAPAGEDLLRTVSGLSSARARDGLCAGTGSGLLAEDARGLVSFRHVLARGAISEAIPGRERRVLHLRAGRGLEGVSPLPVARLARHFRETGDTGTWCRYAEQAADLAVASGDEAAAGVLLRDLITDGGLPARRAAGLLDKITFGSFSDSTQFREIVSGLRSLLEAGIGEPAEEALVRFQLGRLLTLMDEFGACRAELELAVPHLGNDPARLAWAMTVLGWPHDLTSTASVHLRWLRRTQKVTDSLGTTDRLRLLVLRATALLCLGEQTGWLAAARIPADAATGFERALITNGLLNTGDLAAMWGRYSEARRRLARAAELAETHEYRRYRELILAAQAHLDWMTGAWDGLSERAGHLAAAAEMEPGARLDAALVAGLLHAATGDPPLAANRFRLVLSERLRRGEAAYVMEPAAALARLSLADGRADDALTVTDEPMAILARKRTWIWAAELAPARLEALTTVGRIAEATELVTAFGLGLRGRAAPAPRAALILCRGILAGANGEHDRAAAWFARAASAWQALPRPYDALLARERQAACLLAIGEKEAGLELLSDVQQGLSRLGATADADRVAGSLRRRGVTVPRVWRGGRRGYGSQLSPREAEVVRLVIAGHTNKQIAGILFRSPRTVEGQLNSAMRKLGVSSRTALAVTVLGGQGGVTEIGSAARLPLPRTSPAAAQRPAPHIQSAYRAVHGAGRHGRQPRESGGQLLRVAVALGKPFLIKGVQEITVVHRFDLIPRPRSRSAGYPGRWRVGSRTLPGDSGCRPR